MRIALGTSIAQRHLSYSLRPGLPMPPPVVATTAGAGRLEGEIYPFALTNPDTMLAGVGVLLGYDRTFGLHLESNQVSTNMAPVDQSHYELGLRFRFGVGGATVALGLDYAHRQYVIDQSHTTIPFDVPDVEYQAIAPTVAARVPVAAPVTIFAALDVLLMLAAGPIASPEHYGRSDAYGIGAVGGADIALGKQIVVRVALEYSRIALSFSGNGPLANGRDGDPTTVDVTGATDRSIGITATVGLAY
jgi:hypothetical protein